MVAQVLENLYTAIPDPSWLLMALAGDARGRPHPAVKFPPQFEYNGGCRRDNSFFSTFARGRLERGQSSTHRRHSPLICIEIEVMQNHSRLTFK